MIVRLAPALLAILLAACQPGSGSDGAAPGDSSDRKPYSGIAANERIRFIGTEPFWGGQTEGGTLTYSTPENGKGETISVKRFAGRGGISVAGKLGEASLDLTVTPGDCSDGMSDRTYPYVATLRLGDETRLGCAWTDTKGFIGPDKP
jgi:uncharacterized membrane protein